MQYWYSAGRAAVARTSWTVIDYRVLEGRRAIEPEGYDLHLDSASSIEHCKQSARFCFSGSRDSLVEESLCMICFVECLGRHHLRKLVTPWLFSSPQ